VLGRRTWLFAALTLALTSGVAEAAFEPKDATWQGTSELVANIGSLLSSGNLSDVGLLRYVFVEKTGYHLEEESEENAEQAPVEV